MSSDDADAWSIPDTSTTPTASAPSAPSAAPAAVSDTGIGIMGGLGALEQPRTAQPNRALWLIVAALLLLAGGAQIGYLFGHSEVVFPGQRNYDALAVAADHGLQAAILFAYAALVFIRRTREVAAGLVLGISALSLAYYFGDFRPLVFKLEDHVSAWTTASGLTLLAVAGVLALVVVVRQPRAGTVRRRQSRTDRVSAMTLGFFGAAILFIGECVDTFRVDLNTGSASGSVNCCGWSHVTGWPRAEMVVGGTVLLLLAVFAATLSSKTLAAGLLIGAALLPVASFAEVVMLVVTPVRAFEGFHAPPAGLASTRIAVSLAAGFWLDLLGMILLVSAAVARLLLGRRRNPYSAQPYAAPGHSAPVP